MADSGTKISELPVLSLSETEDYRLPLSELYIVANGKYANASDYLTGRVSADAMFSCPEYCSGLSDFISSYLDDNLVNYLNPYMSEYFTYPNEYVNMYLGNYLSEYLSEPLDFNSGMESYLSTHLYPDLYNDGQIVFADPYNEPWSIKTLSVQDESDYLYHAIYYSDSLPLSRISSSTPLVVDARWEGIADTDAPFQALTIGTLISYIQSL